MGFDIEILRWELAEACDFVIGHGGAIGDGGFGTDDAICEKDDVSRGVVREDHCYCPIGALELYRRQPRDQFDFSYDSFVEGFDSDIDWIDVEGRYRREPEGVKLYELGRAFRKRYLKEAA